MKSQIANSKLSDKGELSYNWAYNHMPALSRIIEKTKEEQPLSNRKIGVCLHITKETSALIIGLKTLGAQVYLCGANPLSTQDDIAAYLDSQGITVYGWRGQNTSEYIDSINNVLNSKTEIIMDDGSDVHALVHSEKKFLELIEKLNWTQCTLQLLTMKILMKSKRICRLGIGTFRATKI